MTLTIEQMEFLQERGLSLSDVIEFARLIERPKRSAAAERQARYRARVKGDDVTRDVTCDGDSDVTPALSPSPKENNSNPHPHTHPGISPRARKADEFPCPDKVDPVDWEALKDNRRAKRAALSAGAHRQIAKKLDGWERDGWPPGPIVAFAAERGWTTVFETDEMKGQPNGQRTSQHRGPGSQGIDRRSSLARAIDEGLEFLGGSAQAGFS